MKIKLSQDKTKTRLIEGSTRFKFNLKAIPTRI